ELRLRRCRRRDVHGGIWTIIAALQSSAEPVTLIQAGLGDPRKSDAGSHDLTHSPGHLVESLRDVEALGEAASEQMQDEVFSWTTSFKKLPLLRRQTFEESEDLRTS